MDLTLVLSLLGGAAGLLAAARLLRGAWRVNRRIVRTVDLVPRMANLVEELSPNSGHSIKDKVGETAKRTERTEEKVDKLRQDLNDHIDNHPGG